MSDHIFNDLYSQLYKDFGNDVMKPLFLMILAGFYPFIAEVGFPITLPIGIVAEGENEIMHIAEYLDLFQPHTILPTSAKPKDVEKHLASPCYGSVFFTLHEGRYTSANLQEIVSASQKIGCDIHKNFLVLIFAIREVPPKYEGTFAGTIFIDGNARMAEKTRSLGRKFIKEMIPFAISHKNEIKNESERRLAEREDGVSAFDVPAILLGMFLRTQRLTAVEIEKCESVT